MTSDEILKAIAAEFGTPTYVYDLDLIREHATQIAAALPDTRICYAIKANPSAAVLRTLAAIPGMGAEAITLGELGRALAAGFPPSEVVVGGPAQSTGLREAALEAGVGLVSLDSASQWHDWSDMGMAAGSGPGFLVRVNPALDPRTHEHLATGSADSKFGMAPAEALALARELAERDRFEGFHIHVGSQISDPAVYEAALQALEPLIAGVPGTTLDAGGGFRVPDFPLADYAALVTGFVRRHGLGLMVEPGRFLVAEAGTLLTQVLHVKEGPLTHVIADAGMADLLRPALYGAEHPVRVVGSDGPAHATVDIDGPLCENADRLRRGVSMPELRKGDLLAVGHAGAYGFTMASNYASSLRPAEVVVEGGKARLARRRETPPDLMALEI